MDPAEAPRPFPNLWQGIGVALAYLALSNWMTSALYAVSVGLHLPAWLAVAPALLVGFPLALVFALWLGRLDLWDILTFHRVRPGIWLPLFLTHLGFFILIQAFAHGLGWALDLVLPEALRTQLAQQEVLLNQTPRGILILIFLGAAVAEEVLFRGFILRGFLLAHRARVAIWMSALLFMAAHGNPLQFPVALMIGVCAGWYYQETGSLWPGLAAHALQNLLAGLSLDPEALSRGSLAVYPLPQLSWMVAAPMAVACGLLWLRWEFRRPRDVRPSVLGLGESEGFS